MTDLLVAVACDQTRVFSHWFSDPLTNKLYPGATMGHHSLTHDEPGEQPEVNMITKFIMGEFAYMVEALASVPEGDQTVLDHMVVLATSETSKGQTHSFEEMPIVLAGNACGALNQGIHYRSHTGENTSKVMLSLVRAMGINAPSFGLGAGGGQRWAVCDPGLAVSFSTLFGCGGVSDTGVDTAVIEDQVCDELDKTQVAIANEMWFAQISVNLDGDGAAAEDYVSHGKDAGVDGNLGLEFILELTEGAAIEVYIQDINNGEVLIMLEMEDLDDPYEDEVVATSTSSGTGNHRRYRQDHRIGSDLRSKRDLHWGGRRRRSSPVASSRPLPSNSAYRFQIFDIQLGCRCMWVHAALRARRRRAPHGLRGGRAVHQRDHRLCVGS